MLRTFSWLTALGLVVSLCATHAQAQGFEEGDWEFILVGSGTSDNDFDATVFSASGSLGYFLTDSFELGARQTVGISESDGTDINGGTRIFADLHIPFDGIVPFIGVNIGYLYGDNIDDTFIAGPEAGLKWFVNSTTFLFGQVEYSFLFDDTDDVDSNFDDGAFFYSLGIGFRW